MPDHKTSGGLTISASDSNDFEVFGGVVVFSGSYYCLRPVVGKSEIVVKGELLEGFFEGGLKFVFLHRTIIAYMLELILACADGDA